MAQPASATPNPVRGTTTSLAALGADDGGESNLRYTWKATAEPGGATPVYSANGTNAAKKTVVTFNRAGAYTFLVTITDQGGLSVTSSVNVTVKQVTTSILVTPSSVSLADRATQQFSAEVLDQFSQAMATQPRFSWSKPSGRGAISKTGLYTAPQSGSGTAVVQATANGVSGRATITYSPAASPALIAMRRRKAPTLALG